MADRIQVFDEKNIESVHSVFKSLCNTIAKTFGLHVDFGNASVSAETFKLTVTFKTTVSEDSSEPGDFRQKARRIGLPEDWWGKEFQAKHNGTYHTFTIREINTRNRRYKVLLDYADGSLKGTVGWVKENVKKDLL